jgi:hypothetical protein
MRMHSTLPQYSESFHKEEDELIYSAVACVAARIVIAKSGIYCIIAKACLPIDQFTMYRRMGLMSFGHQISNWETGNLYFSQGELPTPLNQPSENAGSFALDARLGRKSGLRLKKRAFSNLTFDCPEAACISASS